MKHLTLFILLFCSLLAAASPALAKNDKDDPKARAIMEKVEDREDGDNQESDMTMILIDKNDSERIVRSIPLPRISVKIPPDYVLSPSAGCQGHRFSHL